MARQHRRRRGRDRPIGGPGSIPASAVCILPEILISQYAGPFYFGGTSLLIVVSVTMDTVGQIHAHMLAHRYRGPVTR